MPEDIENIMHANYGGYSISLTYYFYTATQWHEYVQPRIMRINVRDLLGVASFEEDLVDQRVFRYYVQSAIAGAQSWTSSSGTTNRKCI